jgi:3-hydroxyisobutyrate dehydrogenase-like beta-hydroxyacid dehydrogenase
MVVSRDFAMAALAGLSRAAGRGGRELRRRGCAAKLLLGHSFDNAFFQLALAEKDVALALASARGLGVPMPVIEAAHDTYARALAMGLGPKLFAATLLAVEDAAGVTLPPLEAR